MQNPGSGSGMSGGGGMQRSPWQPQNQYPNRLNNNITAMKMPAPFDGKTGAFKFPAPAASPTSTGGVPPIMTGNPQDVYQQWLQANGSPGGDSGTPSGGSPGGDSAAGTGPTGDAW